MDLVVEVINKDTNKIMAPYGKISQCLDGYFSTNVWDIRISGVNKVLNKMTIIVD